MPTGQQANKQTSKQVTEKTPQVKQANNTKEVKPAAEQLKKPPEVKTYKQEVIMSVSFDLGKKDQAVVIPKDPKKYGLVKEGYEMEEWGPTSIAVDKQENIYVLDSVASRIKKYDKDGRFIKNILSPLPDPNDIAVDDEGNIYLMSESGPDDAYEVVKIDQTGKVLIGYKVSDDLSPPGVGSLIRIQIINGFLYSFFSISDFSHPALFYSATKLPKGYEGDISVKIGSTKQAYDSTSQIKNITLGVVSPNKKSYRLMFEKKELAFTDGKKITIINYKNYPTAESGNRDILKIDKKENVYFYDVITYKKRAYFLTQKYNSGSLTAETILPFASAYQWVKLADISDKGIIYYLYSDNLGKAKEGVKIIKCTLK